MHSVMGSGTALPLYLRLAQRILLCVCSQQKCMQAAPKEEGPHHVESTSPQVRCSMPANTLGCLKAVARPPVISGSTLQGQKKRKNLVSGPCCLVLVSGLGHHCLHNRTTTSRSFAAIDQADRASAALLSKYMNKTALLLGQALPS